MEASGSGGGGGAGETKDAGNPGSTEDAGQNTTPKSRPDVSAQPEIDRTELDPPEGDTPTVRAGDTGEVTGTGSSASDDTPDAITGADGDDTLTGADGGDTLDDGSVGGEAPKSGQMKRSSGSDEDSQNGMEDAIAQAIAIVSSRIPNPGRAVSREALDALAEEAGDAILRRTGEGLSDVATDTLVKAARQALAEALKDAGFTALGSWIKSRIGEQTDGTGPSFKSPN